MRRTAECCAVTTTIAAAMGVVVTLSVSKIRYHIFNLLEVLNRVLTGLVAITACCIFVKVYPAISADAIDALVYIAAALYYGSSRWTII